MKHIPNAVTNEEGSVLLLTLALLVLLTIAGLALLSTTDTDLQITQNDRCYKQNLTRAESAVMEAAQIMAYYESTASKLKPPKNRNKYKCPCMDRKRFIRPLRPHIARPMGLRPIKSAGSNSPTLPALHRLPFRLCGHL